MSSRFSRIVRRLAVRRQPTVFPMSPEDERFWTEIHRRRRERAERGTPGPRP